MTEQVIRDGITPEDMARQSEREQEIAAARERVCAAALEAVDGFGVHVWGLLKAAVAELRRLEGK
jgi:hypothetical protein